MSWGIAPVSISQASLPCSDGFLEYLLTYSDLQKFPRFPSLSMVPFGTSTTTCVIVLLHPYQKHKKTWASRAWIPDKFLLKRRSIFLLRMKTPISPEWYISQLSSHEEITGIYFSQFWRMEVQGQVPIQADPLPGLQMVLFLFGRAYSMQRFSGQESDPCHSSDNIWSLTSRPARNSCRQCLCPHMGKRRESRLSAISSYFLLFLLF